MGRFFTKAIKKEIEEPLVNLTPLIDVVFVILIMFIVMAPLLEIDRIELADAHNSSQSLHSVQESSPIAVYVHADNSIWMNNQKLSLDGLTENLLSIKKNFPNAIPQLFHDKRAYFGTYTEVKSRIELAGFEEMEIVLKPS